MLGASCPAALLSHSLSSSWTLKSMEVDPYGNARPVGRDPKSPPAHICIPFRSQGKDCSLKLGAKPLSLSPRLLASPPLLVAPLKVTTCGLWTSTPSQQMSLGSGPYL
eukprot:3219821-Karenia_brevis.AAC.1